MAVNGNLDGSQGLQRIASQVGDRLATAEEVAGMVRPGDRVFVGTACATPRVLLKALEDADTYLKGVKMYHFLTDGAVFARGGEGWTRFQHEVFFVGSDMKEILKKGKVDYIPISLMHVPAMIHSGRIPVDVALIQVTPPDEHGYVSLGVSVDIVHAAVRKANRVFAEVNPNMPWTEGDTKIPVDRMDRLVWVDTPVIEFEHKSADAEAEQVARYVARIINDGSTLQIGLGRIPNEMLKYLTSRRDLGIHSDVICEPVVDLIDKGVITGREKGSHTGQVVASYCMGTRRLYERIHRNSGFSFHPIEYVCDPSVLAGQRRLVSVSQAFAMDLTGQVCADQFEGEFYSGVSTQLDFHRAAAASPEGKAIVCMASTTEGGKASRIRPSLRAGEGVTIPRSDVHFVVTEYGMAYLFGKSIQERAVSLIELAHPSFRPWLLEEAKRLGYVSEERRLRSQVAYPADEEREGVMRDGRTVRIRPSRGSDVEMLQELFYHLRPEDIFTRFFTNLKSLSTKNAEHLCSVGYEREMAFVAVTGERENEKIVGNACYFVDPSSNMADVAYLVHQDWQGCGLGQALQKRMVEYARSKGIRGFTADILPENKGMLALIAKCGFPVQQHYSQGACEARVLFEG